MKITDGIFYSHQNVRASQENHWLIVCENLLYAIESFLSLLVHGRSELFLHEFIYFCFPRRCGIRLRRIP